MQENAAFHKNAFLGLTLPEWVYVLFCFGLYFACSMTFIENAVSYGPDEGERLLVPAYIAEYCAIPTGEEAYFSNDVWGFSYALQMKLPYLIGGLNMWIAQIIGGGIGLLAAARLVSCLSMAGVAFYAVRLTKRGIASPCRWIWIILLTLTPQSLFLGTYFNLDAYSLFAVLMIVDGWAEGVRSRWSVKSCAYLGLSMGLCVLGYEYAYGFLAASVLLYVGWYLLHRREQSFRRFFGRGCCIAAVFLLVCGWYFLRNYLLYEGDIFAYRIQNVYAEQFARAELKPSQRNTLQRQGLSILGMLLHTNWLEDTLKSAFGVLGCMSISLPAWTYVVHYLFLLSGVVAFGALRSKKIALCERDGERRLFATALLLGAAINVGLSLYASWARDYQPQGRYVIYAFLPVFLATAAGWQRLTERLASLLKRNPTSLQRGLTVALLLFLATADGIGFVRLLKLRF